ncbi:lipopolysaccharide biosynthesis protein [Pseudothauera rhizosphaerae]|uniref:Lipopolysaccharide biosynthesis protein n=1 Tax=Pseudothauera rhizosphaerae TaxID=2565932 RepID=A0A4S4ASU8_9RHOO|nr:lipopolysaccharide biosynthesis protein [Pseudothauera rhizosphaerae]THF61609.1 lipopolysaccharide biosynthesis protein [Pseudothauera rhizosphaerae]
MPNVSSKIVRGAAWMVGLRLLQRSLGLISTVVLARLLLPEDFGLVAMALAFYALVELIGFLGFDAALIRKKAADRVHYDTAWTLGILLKGATALILYLSAPAVAAFYDEPRIREILYVFALVSLVGAFENIGIVNFRKELSFDQEFRFQLMKKLISVVATVALALYFRSYWALAFGMLASAIVGVLLSYVMHAYRPGFSLGAWREMLGFSVWMSIDHIISFIRERGSDFVVGKFLPAQALGAYRVGSELASLPTTQLYLPVMRAVFPGYAKIVDDPQALRSVYLSTQASIATIVLPVTVGLVLLAEPLVLLLLGPRWGEAVPLVRVLGLYGITRLLQGNRNALFVAKGKPSWLAALGLLEVTVMFPLIFYWLLNGGEVVMVGWAKVIASLVILPLGVYLVCSVVAMSGRDFLGTVWRPVLACGAMSLAVWLVGRSLDFAPDEGGAALALAALVPLGALVYLVALGAFWLVAGRPRGIEYSALALLGRWPRIAALVRRILPK